MFLHIIRFQVKKKQFFRNFITIILFGAIGTLISFVIISLGKLLKPLVQFAWSYFGFTCMLILSLTTQYF
jgi:hypothetical protein